MAVTDERVDTRPLRTAATAQSPIVAVGTFGAGLGPVYLGLVPGPLGRLDVLIAVALSVAPTMWAQVVALARTVRAGERETTPWRDPRNDRGEALRPPDQDAYERAIAEVAELRAAAASAQSGTSRFPAVGDARSMRAAEAAADGPPSKQHYDWAGDGVRAYDEDVARERGRDPNVRRGRAVADRNDRLAADRPRHYLTDDRG